MKENRDLCKSLLQHMLLGTEENMKRRVQLAKFQHLNTSNKMTVIIIKVINYEWYETCGLVGKPEGKVPFDYLCVSGRIILKRIFKKVVN